MENSPTMKNEISGWSLFEIRAGSKYFSVYPVKILRAEDNALSLVHEILESRIILFELSG